MARPKELIALHCEDERRRRELRFMLRVVAGYDVASPAALDTQPDLALIVAGRIANQIVRELRAAWPDLVVLWITRDLAAIEVREHIRAALKQKRGPKPSHHHQQPTPAVA